MKLNLPLGFLSRLTLLTVGTQDYMKLSDVYRMYSGGCRPERGEPASHNRSFAVDAALTGACCEVPTLPVCLFISPVWCPCLLCHVAPSAGCALNQAVASLIHRACGAASTIDSGRFLLRQLKSCAEVCFAY